MVTQGYRILLDLAVFLLLQKGICVSVEEVEAVITDNEIQEYCDRESFTADCGDKGVVIMDKAEYGRMKLGRCLKNGFGHMGCKEDILEHMDMLCSGRHRCHIRDVVDELHVHNPCTVADLKVYLQASYHCVTVSPIQELCSPERIAHISQDGTSLASRSLLTPSCLGQSTHHVFFLNGLPGQQLNISLIDFARTDNNRHFCAEYGEIQDEQTKQKTQICGGSQRVKWLMVSNSHKVKVRLNTAAIEEENFIIKLKALGCPDLEPPPQAWVERDGDTATIGCRSSSPKWTLTCEGNKWVGGVGNCTEAVAVVGESKGKDKDSLLPTDVTVALISSAATVFCLAIITIGIILWKRYTVDNRIKKLEASQRIKIITTDGDSIKRRNSKPRPERPPSRPMSRPESRAGSEYMSPIFVPNGQKTEGENAVYDFCFAAPGVQGENPFMDKSLPSIPVDVNINTATSSSSNSNSLGKNNILHSQQVPLIPTEEPEEETSLKVANTSNVSPPVTQPNCPTYQVPIHASELPVPANPAPNIPSREPIRPGPSPNSLSRRPPPAPPVSAPSVTQASDIPYMPQIGIPNADYQSLAELNSSTLPIRGNDSSACNPPISTVAPTNAPPYTTAATQQNDLNSTVLYAAIAPSATIASTSAPIASTTQAQQQQQQNDLNSTTLYYASIMPTATTTPTTSSNNNSTTANTQNDLNSTVLYAAIDPKATIANSMMNNNPTAPTPTTAANTNQNDLNSCSALYATPTKKKNRNKPEIPQRRSQNVQNITK